MKEMLGAIGCGKSYITCGQIIYDLYVETTAHKFSKYKRLPRKLKKSLSSTIKKRIEGLRSAYEGSCISKLPY